MDHLVDQFHAYLLTEKCVARNTYSAYAKDIEQLMYFIKRKKIELKEVKSRDLKEFLRFLKNTGGVSARSLSRKISTLKAFFKFLHERHGLHNCAVALSFPKLEKRLPVYLTETEMKKIFDGAQRDQSDQGKRNYVMLTLLYATGMRVTELTQLTLGDIQFDSGLLTISGKGGKERLVPLPIPIMNVMKEYLNDVHPKLITRKGAPKIDDFLFPVCYGHTIRPISRQAFWGILKRLADPLIDKKHISPHKLRHSLATHMLQKGVDLRSLQLLLGHENLSTVEIYTHVELGYARKIYDKKHPRS